APFIDDDVPGHGEQPAALRATCPFEYGSIAPCPEHGLLHYVLRLDSVAAVEANDVGPQGIGVLVVQGAKQVGVALADESRAHGVHSLITRRRKWQRRQATKAWIRPFCVPREGRQRAGVIVSLFICHLVPQTERSVAFLMFATVTRKESSCNA